MLDRTGYFYPGAQDQAAQHSTKQRVLRMVKNERMGGMVPKWEEVSSAQHDVEQSIELAKNGQNTINNDKFKDVLAYHDATQAEDSPRTSEDGSFGFSDLVDMINPLHHVPVVGNLYRNVTGDEIKPIGKIIGGTLYGGPAGAASNLVNVIIEEETGRDLAGNAIALVRGDPVGKPRAPNAPENALTEAVRTAENGDLPANLLAFADTSRGAGIHIQRSGQSEMYQNFEDRLGNLPPREPITEVKINRARSAYNS